MLLFCDGAEFRFHLILQGLHREEIAIRFDYAGIQFRDVEQHIQQRIHGIGSFLGICDNIAAGGPGKDGGVS